ncbi:MAG: type IX secretion system substrate [Algoriphagus marincola HL-49]|uniref:Type IX secretion system substrate n=1 Tax=Algoriphagus marincola HL-49 TaxID=1305737 RepID=A0A0P7YDW2_9BACT|nr:MAG: type IX secretion system substrate [Algoriphagus marincola HL-49]
MQKIGLIKIVILILMTLSIPKVLFAQCPQNNFVVDGFQLRDANGNPFTVTDEYELGEEINGELWTILGGSSTNGYNLRFFFDIVINDVLIADEQYECLFSGVQA